MTIYLVRHGQTAGNATRTMQFPDTPLAENGLRQADRVAAWLAGVGAGGLLASDHTRAAQTAAAIAQATGLPIRWEPLLQERNFGALRGRRIDELGFDHLAADYAPPGGEDWAMFDARIAQAFEAVVAARAALDRPLVVVSHELLLCRMIRRHLRLPDGTPPPDHLGNTGVTIVEAAAPYRVEVLGSVAHLEDVAAGT